MKKLVLVILIGLLIMTIQAEAKQKHQVIKEVTIDDMLAKMQFQLRLNDAQVQEVKPIIQNYLDQEKY